MWIARARNVGSSFAAYFSMIRWQDSASMRACSGSYTPHGRSQWALAVVVGASQRVSRDMGLLISHWVEGYPPYRLGKRLEVSEPPRAMSNHVSNASSARFPPR